MLKDNSLNLTEEAICTPFSSSFNELKIKWPQNFDDQIAESKVLMDFR